MLVDGLTGCKVCLTAAAVTEGTLGTASPRRPRPLHVQRKRATERERERERVGEEKARERERERGGERENNKQLFLVSECSPASGSWL